MKAVVLAGGRGTRIRPLTHTTSKHLLKVANKPILVHSLEYLKECGVDEFLVITSNEAYDDIYDTLCDLESVFIDDILIQYEPLGIAHALSMAKSWTLDEDFVLYLGDNLFEDKVDLTIGGNTVFLKEVEDPKSFGVAKFIDEKLYSVVEKPTDPPSKFAVAGMYCFTKQAYDILEDMEPSERGEWEITNVINYLIDIDQEFNYEILSGWWLDTGKKDTLLDANRKLLDRIATTGLAGEYYEVARGETLEVSSNLNIVGPSSVHKSIIVSNLPDDTEIGPYVSAGQKLSIYHSKISDSIIDDNVMIVVVDLEESIIGKNCLVSYRSCGVRHELVIGDDSTVLLN